MGLFAPFHRFISAQFGALEPLQIVSLGGSVNRGYGGNGTAPYLLSVGASFLLEMAASGA